MTKQLRKTIVLRNYGAGFMATTPLGPKGLTKRISKIYDNLDLTHNYNDIVSIRKAVSDLFRLNLATQAIAIDNFFRNWPGNIPPPMGGCDAVVHAFGGEDAVKISVFVSEFNPAQKKEFLHALIELMGVSRDFYATLQLSSWKKTMGHDLSGIDFEVHEGIIRNTSMAVRNVLMDCITDMKELNYGGEAAVAFLVSRSKGFQEANASIRRFVE